MTLVVDASIVCKLFLPEERSEAAETAVRGGEVLLAPDLVVAEVANTMWRKLTRGEIPEEEAKAIVAEVPRLFDRFVPAADLAGRAFEIAARLGQPIYDCLYIALAEREGCAMVTADRRLASRLAGSAWDGVARCLV